MVEKKEKKKKNPKEEVFEMLEKEKKKEQSKKMKEFYRQIATRDIIERDFIEDVVHVTFETAPNVKRTVLARRPTHKEMMKLMKLAIEAGTYQGKTDPKAMERMLNIIKDFSTMAADFTLDESLDEEFWSEHVSYTALQNFIMELVTQAITGGTLSNEELESFR